MKLRSTLALLGAVALPLLAHAAGDGKAKGPFGWLMDPTTNVAFLAMIVFLLIAHRFGAFKAITGGLDKRAQGIADQLEEARTLREAAARTLAEAERRESEAQEQADKIIKEAEAASKAMVAEARESLKQRMARREALAEERITRAEADAAAEVRRVAAETATKAAEKILAADTSTDQFERAAQQIESALN